MSETARAGDWGCTFTGMQYWPDDPQPADICIEDVAHALSLQCRFGGHCREFYSVAEHSVRVARECPESDRLWGLLHDASEAFLVDIPRPVKRSPLMAGYRTMEDSLMRAVCTRFGLPEKMPQSVKRADEVLLATEARDLMPEHSVRRWTLIQPPLPWRINPWTPAQSERAFLSLFRALAATPTEATPHE